MYDSTSKVGASRVYDNEPTMESPPREIDMLIKRAEECASYANSVHQRISQFGDRMFGPIPEATLEQGGNTLKGGAGSIYALSEAINRIERNIAWLDGASRRLENL